MGKKGNCIRGYPTARPRDCVRAHVALIVEDLDRRRPNFDAVVLVLVIVCSPKLVMLGAKIVHYVERHGLLQQSNNIFVSCFLPLPAASSATLTIPTATHYNVCVV